MCAAIRSRRSRPTACATGKQSFELDAIVFATGFDAMTGALREIDVRTSDGPMEGRCCAIIGKAGRSPISA